MVAAPNNPANGGVRVGAGRPAKIEFDCAPGYTSSDLRVNDGKERTPLEYMLDVMNDPAAAFRRRDTMAMAAASFCHARIAENRIGKKEAASAAAKAKEEPFFMPSLPPRNYEQPSLHA